MTRRFRWPAMGAGAVLLAGGVIGGPVGGAQAAAPGCQVRHTPNGVTCRVSHAAPTATLTSPAAGGATTAGGTVRLTASARAFGGADVKRVAFYDDAKLLGVATSAPYTFDWKNVPAGQHSLYARAYDGDGLSGESAPAGLRVTARPAVVAGTSTLLVPHERGGTVAVRLSARPSAPVTVTVDRADGGTGLTATRSLRFTPENWARAQRVTISSRGTGTPTSRFRLTAPGYAPAGVATAQTRAANAYTDRFTTLYNKLTDSANGYFSPQGIPYHSVETLMAEAPDQGHETTSEAWSYLIWTQAVYGDLTGDWSRFNGAWSLMEQYMIPTHADQPAMGAYNPAKPATYAPEQDTPDQYPARLDTSIPVGQDPITGELRSTYGTNDIYGMHWLSDVDNTYGYGDTPGGGCESGPSASGPSYINTFQRGPQESVWETIPQPTCDHFVYGGPNGYLDLFTGDNSYAHQWKFTDAPDADARAIQAAYWADTWAKAQGKGSDVSGTVAKAGKMGDYLRYAFFDKYFKQIGNCTSPSSCPGGTGRSSEHYLLSWYYAWGGAADSSWAWLIGDGAAHQGYQNPMAAYALTTDSAMEPKSATGVSDWQTSLSRQLEFYRWLQSPEGGIAGGATNSWAGRYGTPPSGTPTFHGMYYDWEPVYHDPPSNNWFGMQAWSMERVAEYYYATGNATAKALLDKWVPWAISQTRLNSDGTFQVPSTLSWSGAPDTWNASSPGSNANLHVTVTEWGTDLGVTGALAQTLAYYAAKSGDADAKSTAKTLLDDIWNNDQDALGVSAPETRADYSRFADPVYVPSGWSGTMPNGDKIQPGATFLSIRSWYRNDPSWPKVQNYLDGGPAPSFTYHRFWAESGIAIAMAAYGRLFGE